MVETGFIVFILFFFGICMGSFLHVVAERYQSSRSAFSGRSYCPHCKKTLSAPELVPIFSYTFSRAKCIGCKAEIPAHYAVIELLTGILAVALLISGNYILFIAACILVILIRIDSRTMLLPDGYIYALTIIASVYALVVHRDVNDIALSVLVGAGSLYLLWVITGGRGIGFGDVKLMIPLGILFGLRGVITLLFFSFFAGGVVSIFLLAAQRVTSKTAVPFGPFLAGSALCILVFPGVIDLFLGFLGYT